MAKKHVSGLAVRDVMQRGVIAVSASAKLENAARLIRQAGVGVLVVVEKNRLVGIVGENDLNGTEGSLISSVMRPPVYCTAEEPLESAIKVAINSGLPRVPVVDNEVDMRCLGIVSASDMMAHLKGKKK
jgi:CBS domain-containing protein